LPHGVNNMLGRLLTTVVAVAGAIEVLQPADIAGQYADAPLSIAPSNYSVTEALSIADACPCDWSPGFLAGYLKSRILLVPDYACPPSCSAADVICVAAVANASAVLFSCKFNSPINEEPGDESIAEIVDDEYLVSSPAQGPGDCAVSSHELNTNTSATATSSTKTCTALPAAYIMSNTSELLYASAKFINSTNATVPKGLDTSGRLKLLRLMIELSMVRGMESSLDCSIYAYVPLVYLLLVPVWWLLTVVWTWNTYRANAASARDLHRLLCWVPVVQFVHGILSLFNYSSCPWEGTIALVYATFWAVATILKEPVMLLCLLLVAKGWCITRNALTRREVCVAGSIVALLYAAVSVQLSLQSIISLLPMVAMYLAVLADVACSILANLRILKAQLLALRSFGIDPRSTPVHRKYLMFIRLARFTFLFVVLETSIHTAFTGHHDSFYWLFVLLHQLMELVIAVGIGYTFRAQPFNVLFQQVQQVATELADQMLPTITTVEVKDEEIDGSNLIAWRASLDLSAHPNGAPLPDTLVVLNPGDEEMPQPRATSTRASGASAAASAAASGAVSAQAASAVEMEELGVTAEISERPSSRVEGLQGAPSPQPFVHSVSRAMRQTFSRAPPRGSHADRRGHAAEVTPAELMVTTDETGSEQIAALVVTDDAGVERRSHA